MSEKKKISVRKILQVLLTMVVTTGCVMAIVSASKLDDKSFLKSISIQIKNDKKYHFIEQTEIMKKVFYDKNIDIMHTPFGKLNIQSIETVLKEDPWVEDVEVYIDNNKVLNIYVTQRIPVARLFSTADSSFYMDNNMHFMPLSDKSIYYTTVFTNVPPLKEDSLGIAMKGQILALVHNIQRDTFWNMQVSEIIIDSMQNFELLTVLGNQTIKFGDTARMKEKFDNLFSFYKKILNRIGWDKYQVLDLRYKGQIVATPSLPYYGPVDKNITNMNWVSSMIEAEAKDAQKDSLVAAIHEKKVVVKEKVKKELRVEKSNVEIKKEDKKDTKNTNGKKDIKDKLPTKDTKQSKDIKYLYNIGKKNI